MHQKLDALIAGYKRFKARYFDQDSSFFKQLIVHGQQPKVLVIACCDSRVDPALLTDCGPGDLFVVRNVANLVPPYEHDSGYHGTSAALEFGIVGLNICNVLILGHSHCGGIQALLSEQSDPSTSTFIGRWMSIAKQARTNTLLAHKTEQSNEHISYCAQESLKLSLANLMSFPFIAQRVGNGTLFLHAWYFDLDRGIVHAFDAASNTFIPV